MLSDTRKRRGIWVALTVFAFAIAGIYNDQRTCRTPEFGLPADCDAGWTVLVLAGFAVAFVAVEAWLAVRKRLDSRPCPRCGHRVPNGTLACGECGYEFG